MCALSCERRPVRNSEAGRSRGYDTNTAANVYRQLNLAHTNADSLAIDAFFVNWNKTILPADSTTINSTRVTREVYAIYKAFFRDHDSLPIDNMGWDGKLHTPRYYVIQDQIDYTCVSYYKGFGMVTKHGIVTSFRPSLLLPQDKILYLTDAYNIGINRFLGIDTAHTEALCLNDSEQDNRVTFMRAYFSIKYGARNKRMWRLCTYPHIGTMIFGDSLDHVLFDFSIISEGGTVTMKKIKGEWVIERVEGRWVE